MVTRGAATGLRVQILFSELLLVPHATAHFPGLVPDHQTVRSNTVTITVTP